MSPEYSCIAVVSTFRPDTGYTGFIEAQMLRTITITKIEDTDNARELQERDPKTFDAPRGIL